MTVFEVDIESKKHERESLFGHQVVVLLEPQSHTTSFAHRKGYKEANFLKPDISSFPAQKALLQSPPLSDSLQRNKQWDSLVVSTDLLKLLLQSTRFIDFFRLDDYHRLPMWLCPLSI